ncbi:DNA-binding protein [Actinoplanes sp. ATCC 53533]|nr:DNA-binding protein [Actinoplanes sp. ATCC 53533]
MATDATPLDDDLVILLPAQVAEIFRCSEWWIKEQARKERIPYCKAGGSYKFSRQHVKEIARIFSHDAATPAPANPGRPSKVPRKPRRTTVAPSSESVQLVARIPRRAQAARQQAA